MAREQRKPNQLYNLGFNNFQIVKGLPSAKAWGYTGVTELEPDSIDLLSGNLTLTDEGGALAWSAKIPPTKAGGIWADSSVLDGRELTAAPDGNAVESIRVTISGDPQAKLSAINKLKRFGRAAADYHQSEWQTTPVYLQVRAVGANFDSYSLIYLMDIDVDDDELSSADDPAYVTLSIEREPYWNAAPPGMNPKWYTLLSRGLQPSTVSDGAKYFNHSDLNLMSSFGGATLLQSLIQTNIRNYDEIGTGSVNYVDIPARLIPGSAPALALINFTPKASATANVLIARSTRRDLFPANNNNSTTQRARGTFNGGDITIGGSLGGITVTKPVTATGLYSNGSTSSRYVLQAVYPAATVNAITLGTWTRAINQYPGRYAVYIRAQVTAGSATNTALALSVGYGSSNLNLRPIGGGKLAQSGFGLTYMGIADFTLFSSKLAGIDGRGVDGASTFNLILSTTKTNSATPTIQIWDVILMPIDEPNGVIVVDFASLASNEPAFLDSTGYFSGGKQRDVAVTHQAGQLAPRRLRGTAIDLIPGINNRIYILADMNAPNVTTAHEIRVDIVPRWYYLRDD